MIAPAERIEPLLDRIERSAPITVAERRPSRATIEAVAELGLLRILPPVAYGGGEATALEFLELVERVARVDGSAAWTIMTLNEEMEIAAAHLPAETMKELCADEPARIVAGSGLPSGRSEAVDGGWLVNGRWTFVTGGPVADHLVLGTIVDEAPPRRLNYVVVAAADVEILDTWDTAGMRGTGSHDVTLDRVFVPSEWSGLTRSADQTVPDTTLFRLPSALRFPFPKVGVAAGIGRAVIDRMIELAGVKAGRVGRSLLRDRPDVQQTIAEAEAELLAGRAFAVEMLQTVWALAEQGRSIPADVHARTRLACSHSVAASVRAAEKAAGLAGTTANAADGPFAGRLADVRAVPQHFMVGAHHRHQAGRVLLGLEPDDPLF